MGWPRISRDYGSILLGSVDDSTRVQRVRIQTLLTTALVVANVIGIVIVAALGAVGIPDPNLLTRELLLINVVVLPVYAVLALVVGVVVGTLTMVRSLRWSIDGVVPTNVDARRTIAARRRLVALQGMLWLGAAIIFGIWYGVKDVDLVPKVVLITAMAGAVVVTIAELFTELLLRPVQAKLVEGGWGLRGASVRSRAVIAWAIGTGIPLTGIFLVVLFGMLRPGTSKTSMFVSVSVLSAVAGAVGLLVMVVHAWSITGPIRSVRDGMARVRRGDLGPGVDLVVYDGSELGELQYGFNTMVSGLREEERLRDIFGRHVGRDVAAAALRGDPELGGAERTVAVVFVDVIGSTTLATERTPTEVVDLLNRFFAVIVEATEQNAGLVNKFEGDAVLSIFGAPLEIDNPAAAALRAARQIADRLAVEVPQVGAGIGVSYGNVVAGNVGAIQRFEYTVIGDPVNESARLSEVAKTDPRRPFASGRAILAAGRAEAANWEPRGGMVLRGRSVETPIFVAQLINE